YVVGSPAAVAQQEPVIHRDLGGAARHDLAMYRRVATVHARGGINDPLTGELLDAGDVGPLEEIGEQAHELGLLLGRSAVPVMGERASRHLVEVEELGGDSPDLGATHLGAR